MAKASESKSGGKPTQVKLPVLALPYPHRISGDMDSMIESTISERFKTIILVKTGEKDVNVGTLVLSHTPDGKDPNVQVSNWNKGLGHLTRYIITLVNAWTSGVTMSGDGSALYVPTNTDTVLKALPQLKGYDLVLVTGGRAGAAKYRISIPEIISQVTARAKVIATSVELYGLAQGKGRTKKADSAPEITTVL